MTGTADTPTSLRVGELLAAAEPDRPKLAVDLVRRLAAAGRLLGCLDAGGAATDPGALDLEIRGLAYDSRRARPGGLFVAVPGAHTDGHEHLPAAAGAGATVAIVERPVASARVPQLVVDSSQRALAIAAAWWYGDPSRRLGVVGVTGTDGKTTTTALATAALVAAGFETGSIGTVGMRIGGSSEAALGHVTTPEAPELQQALAAMVRAGDRAAVVESTSHGLALDRVGGIAYDAAVFTNLTHEHLEFHGSFEAYRAAKRSLFERLGAARERGRKLAPAPDWPAVGVVNLDDPSAETFAAATHEAGARLVTYGLDSAADVRATEIHEDARRLRISAVAPDWRGSVALRLAGRFNVHNALAVLALGVGLGLDLDAVGSGLESVEGVPGRMERVDAGQPFGVIVDYAHSPAALERVLDLLGPVAAAGGGALIAVFGSAGERDVQKRPMMGRVAGERCRLVVVTDEDPRGEDRDAILDQIAVGAEAAGRRRGRDLLLIADRAPAIEAAFRAARPGDIVLLAGKGHEQSIIGPSGPIAWDERAAATAALASLGYRR